MRRITEGIRNNHAERWFTKDEPGRLTLAVNRLEQRDHSLRVRLLRLAKVGNLKAELELYKRYKCRIWTPGKETS